MRKYFNFKQILVLTTASFALLIIGIGIAYQMVVLPPSVYIETLGCPVIGKKTAPIEMVLFEDFCCEECRGFHKDVFPQIQEEYLAKGTVRFTIVPLAFLRGSKPLGNAALAVYKMAPDRFLAYVHELCQEPPGAANARLLKIAQKVGGISLSKLEACLTTHCHYQELDKNLELAKEVMGRNFGTPALYINGISTPTGSFDVIEARVDKLSRKGVL